MEITKTPMENGAFIHQLKFPPDIEREFQEHYYLRMRSRIRGAIFLLAGFSVLRTAFVGTGDFSPTFAHFGVAVVFLTALLNLLLVVASFHRNFSRSWQPLVVIVTLLTVAQPLISDGPTALTACFVYLGIIASRLQRLEFRWMAIQCAGVLVLGIIGSIFSSLLLARQSHAFVTINHSPAGFETLAIWGLLGTIALMLSIPLFMTLRSERFERSEFFTKYLLAKDRNEERQKREQTERMLHVLSQAIGGVVHDLGNPLTTVQIGAETLRDFAESGDADPTMVQHLAGTIEEGAKMLNYLRLSLMEQTRVLEGKAVPVELKKTSLCDIVEAGAHYQKPRFAAGRKVTHDGEDIIVRVDEMRFITVFMNLIGNALKYSEGEVRVTWRIHDGKVIVAVQDQGHNGRGISRKQADKLFVAFGRLDTHSQVEGTGLGLLSVRKIVEAHEGEIFIEGHTDGSVTSTHFTTAQEEYPSMLEEGFLTAFVMAYPRDEAPSPKLDRTHKMAKAAVNPEKANSTSP